MASLLLACGNDRSKQIKRSEDDDWSQPLTTIDIDPNCGADIKWDLSKTGIPHCRLPFDDDTFDEIGAFNVLEHWGSQGDWKFYFTEFAEYWRILKPDGVMLIIVPIGVDALADIGHTRFFSMDSFKFLAQKWYEIELGKGKNVSDYRWFWKHNFETLHLENIGNHHIGAILKKVVLNG